LSYEASGSSPKSVRSRNAFPLCRYAIISGSFDSADSPLRGESGCAQDDGVFIEDSSYNLCYYSDRVLFAKFAVERLGLIRPERTVSIWRCGSIDGGEYTSAVEEGKPPVESARRSIRGTAGTATHWPRQVAERRVAGVGVGYGVEIVHAEDGRFGSRIVIRVHIGRRVLRGRWGAIPRIVIGTNVWQIIDLREEEPVRTAINKAGG
jgi:hypothetical protein